jgi:diacylglycerol kinase (ATP)
MLEVLINPCAGGQVRQAKEAVERLCQGRGIPYTVAETRDPQEITRRCQDLAQAGAPRMVVLGGDGTLRDAAQGLRGTHTLLGIVPCGTGNDLIRSIGVPRELDRAAETAVLGCPLAMDLIDLDGYAVVNYLGAGIDSNTTLYAKQSALRGMAAYLYGLFRALAGLRPIRYRCRLDGGEERCGLGVMINVANGAYFGGGIHAFPTASPTDGLLDVMLVRDLKRRQILPVLPKLIRGNHVGHPYVEFLRCREVSFSFEKDTPMSADGEVFTREAFTARVQKGALLVSVPESI